MNTEHQSWQLQLNRGSAEERAIAAEQLSYLGEDAAFAAVDLVKACAADENIRDWAVAALEGMGRPPEDSIAALAEQSLSNDPLVAYWAVTLLGRLGPSAEQAQEPLLELLKTPATDLPVREKAAWAIGQIGPAAKVAVPELQKLLRADQPRLTKLVENAISQLQAG